MIYNAPPALLRSILTQPEDSGDLHPYDMAAWWLVGRAELAWPEDSANLDPNRLAIRVACPRWPRLRRISKAKSAAAQLGTLLRSRILEAKS